MKPAPRREPAVEVTVARLGVQGDGIAEHGGETLFVPFTAPGDRVRVRLGARRGPGRDARVVELIEPGPQRAEPVCRHFGRCGGCAVQHLDRENYRRVKLGVLCGALAKAGIDPVVVTPLRTVPPQRRRARLGLFRPKEARAAAVIGFRERFSHALVDLQECAVLEPDLLALVDKLRRLAPDLLAPGSHAETVLTRTDSGVDLLIEAREPPALAALEALAGFAAAHDLARIVWRTADADTLVVERRAPRVLLSGSAVPFPTGAFLQASVAAEAVLVAEVTAALGAARPALDLYAGLGPFAFALAAAGPVHAVEGDAAATAVLVQAADQMPGVTVERRDLDRDPLPPELLAHYHAAVFDPPRAGAARQAAALAASPIATIAAVSCNPATFARDAATLIAGGYRLERVVPVDQFAWTPHLELVATFRR